MKKSLCLCAGALIAALALIFTGCPTGSDVQLEVEPGTIGEVSAAISNAAEYANKADSEYSKYVLMFYKKGTTDYSDRTAYMWLSGGTGAEASSAMETVGKGKYRYGLIELYDGTSLASGLPTGLKDSFDKKEDVNLIVKSVGSSNWSFQTSDLTLPVSQGAKHFLVVNDSSAENTVYELQQTLSPSILSAVMESGTELKAVLSVELGLEGSAGSSGFEFKDAEGNEIPVVDTKNYDYKSDSDRSHNFTKTVYLKLQSSVDSTKSYTLSHGSFGSRTVITAAAISSIFGDYVYDGDDLGLALAGTKAAFKIWAPTASEVKLLLYATANDVGTYNEDAVNEHAAGSTTDETLKGTPVKTIPMTKNSDGIWSVSEVDVSGAKYYKYQITVAGTTYYVCDINAKAASADSIAAQIVDINSDSSAMPASGTERFDGTTESYVNPFTGSKYNDAIIYEMHIRDWSRAVVTDSTGKFLDIANSSEIINHLKDLGITHVQILPMFDYAQVNADKNYNWGYNPYHYNVPEGRYVTEGYADGTQAVKEMRTMIQALHEAGIAVIMDVVYNHTSGKGSGSLYDSTVPYYYYRMNSDGSYSNGSGCGNEINSAAPMFRKYMIDSLRHWMLDYHVNGFRFDLMGLHEQETMKAIYESLSEIDPKVLVYGEPWTGGGTSPVQNSATISVVSSATYSYGAFDDGFRDSVKGAELGGLKTGQVQGNTCDTGITKGLLGTSNHNSTSYTGLSLRYAECHDNFTLYDKLVYSLPSNLTKAQTSGSTGNIATAWPSSVNSSELTTIKSQDKLAAAYIFLAQGTPFINGGQEFLRSKKGNPDSYAADTKGGVTWTNEAGAYNIDDVNTINLSFKNTYSDVYNTYKGLIALRRSSDAFTDGTSVTAKTLSPLLTCYTTKGSTSGETYVVYFNAGTEATVTLDVSGTEILVSDGTVKNGASVTKGSTLTVGATSFVVIKVEE